MGLKGRSRFSEELQSLGADPEAVPEAQPIFTESLDNQRMASNSNHALSPILATTQTQTQETRLVGATADNGFRIDAAHQGVVADELIHKVDNRAPEEEDGAAVDSSNERFSYETEQHAPTANSLPSGESYNEGDDKSSSQSHVPADHDSYQSSVLPRSSDEEFLGIHNVIEAPSTNLNGTAMGFDYDNDGSVSMSDGGTDEYEPAEVPDMTQDSDMESGRYQPNDALLQGKPNQEEASDIDDDYEPAEEVEPMELDLRNIQPISVDNYQRSSSRQPEPPDERSSDPYSPESVDRPTADDVEDSVELSEANTLTKTQDFPPQPDTGVDTDDVSRCSFQIRVALILAGDIR
jgi:hypothetical protein